MYKYPRDIEHYCSAAAVAATRKIFHKGEKSMKHLTKLFGKKALSVVCAIAIKLDDGGPILFKQNRITFNGKIFKVW